MQDALSLVIDQPKTLEEFIRLADQIDSRIRERARKPSANQNNALSDNSNQKNRGRGASSSQQQQSNQLVPYNPQQAGNSNRTRQDKLARTRRLQRENRCFFCEGLGHRSAECPQRPLQVNSIVELPPQGKVIDRA